MDSNIVVDGSQYAPIGLFYDAELDLGGAGGEATTNDTNSDINFTLAYYNINAFQSVPYCYDFGSNTAESMGLVNDQLVPSTLPSTAGGAYYAYLTAGSGMATLGSVPSTSLILSGSGVGGSITLNWTAPTYTGNVLISSYKVYRGLSAGSETYLATVISPSYIDSSVTFGTSYYYSVTAVNGIGEGPQSNVVNIQPLTAPLLNTILPNPNYNGSISLSWSSPTGATVYHVYRNISLITSLSGLTPIANPTTNSYNDTINNTIGLAGAYYYVVTALNPSATSLISNCVSVIVSPPVITITSPISGSYYGISAPTFSISA